MYISCDVCDRRRVRRPSTNRCEDSSLTTYVKWNESHMRRKSDQRNFSILSLRLLIASIRLKVSAWAGSLS